MENLRKIGRKMGKQMSSGSQSRLPSSHLLGYMEATECVKCPFLITRDTSPSRAYLEVFMSSPSDGLWLGLGFVAQPSNPVIFW
jgi:hypothetical protein